MSDEWQFWRDQLDGLAPQTTPGTPHAGFYVLRRRWTRDNDDPARKPGDPRKKITTQDLPVAIWHDAGWHMIVGREEYYRDADQIDETFSRCCRSAISHDEYERLRNENQ